MFPQNSTYMLLKETSDSCGQIDKAILHHLKNLRTKIETKMRGNGRGDRSRPGLRGAGETRRPAPMMQTKTVQSDLHSEISIKII